MQTNQHAARRVAADAAVGDLHAVERAAQVIAPTLRNRIAEEHQGVLIFIGAVRPLAMTLVPNILKPIRPPNGPRPRQRVVGLGNFQNSHLGDGRRGRRPRCRMWQAEQAQCDEVYSDQHAKRSC